MDAEGADPEQGGAPVPSDGGPLAFVSDLDAPLLEDLDHHHLARVRRVRDGAPIIISDGGGSWRRAVMAGTSPEPSGPVHAVPAPEYPVVVAFALSKGDKPEWCVQKLTELGVDRIAPFIAARSVVRWDPAKRAAAHERFRRIAREAAMQSRSARLPKVDPVAGFGDVSRQPGVHRADRGGSPPIAGLRSVLIGPEGGWDADEIEADLPTVGLGQGVLRAETAAVVAGSLLTALRSGLVCSVR